MTRELVDFRRENEIRFSQAIDGVCPEGDFNFAPAQQHIGMMALLLSQCADSVHERQGRFKVREFISADQMMLLNYFPVRRPCQLLMNFA